MTKDEDMSNTILYGKIGRSMPLRLEKCGSAGGDVEMVATLKLLAETRPEDEIIILGRNSGERPADVGLPKNVINPWSEWGWKDDFKRMYAEAGLGNNHGVESQLKIVDIYDAITNDVVDSADGMVIWVGQHGTTNMPTPGITRKSVGSLTKPQDMSILYSSFVLRAINRWRDVDPVGRDVVLLNSDTRNNLKMRDLAWPLLKPMLTQYTYDHQIRHERRDRPDTYLNHFALLPVDTHKIDRFGHPLWESTVRCEYARLEVNSLVEGAPFAAQFSYDDTNWSKRGRFGVIANETRAYVSESMTRFAAFRDYVLPCTPDWVYGSWSSASQLRLQRTIEPISIVDYPQMVGRVKSTITTPASGSGWATAKPWEAFASGTICFFHPKYDTQNNILGDAPPLLKQWLRVNSPHELRERVNALNEDERTWQALVQMQKEHFDAAVSEPQYMRIINDRLDG